MEIITINGAKIRVFGFFGSIKGLMFDSMEKYDGALIRSNSVWMPFVKFPLYLYFIKGRKVVKTEKAVPISLSPKTWRVYSCRIADFCIESKKDLGLNKGDVVDGQLSLF